MLHLHTSQPAVIWENTDADCAVTVVAPNLSKFGTNVAVSTVTELICGIVRIVVILMQLDVTQTALGYRR